jgi:hypothetical protein
MFDAGIPRYLAEMLPVLAGGAPENVSVVPDTEYVEGSWRTPDTAISTEAVLAGATDIVKATVVPSPLN